MDIKSEGIAGAAIDASTMKKYYERNLSALEKVFDEKRVIERKMRSLEFSLDRVKKGLTPSPPARRPSKSDSATFGFVPASGDEHLPPPTYDSMEDNGHDRLETSSEGGGVQSRHNKRKFLISEHLIKDQEKFLARKKDWEQREAQKIAERESYEKEVYDRFARASKTGKDFSAMLERSEKAKERNKLKAQSKEQKRVEDEKREIEARKKEMQEQLARASFGNANRSWKELVEEEESRRKERIEKRKQEMSSIVARIYVPGDGKKITDALNERRKSEPGVTKFTEFRAEDPDRVAMKLTAMKNAWKEKDEKERERTRQREAEMLLRKSAPKNPLVASMEKRMEQVHKTRNKIAII